MAGEMNLTAAQIGSPLYTGIAREMKFGQYVVADALFPIVNVNTRVGNVIEFRDTDYSVIDSRRGPGQNTKRVTIGYAGRAFSFAGRRLEGQLPVEIQEVAATMDVDLVRRAVAAPLRHMRVEREYNAATLARDTAKYAVGHSATLSGLSQWSDYGATSDPFQVVSDAIETVRAKTGVEPNTMVLPKPVMLKLKRHPKLVETYKYAGFTTLGVDQMREYFGIENIVIADGVRTIETSAGVTRSDLWGKDVILAYTALGSLDMGEPTFGYTYQLNGGPVVEEPYYEPNQKAWNFPTSWDYDQEIAGNTAGFIIKNAVA